MFTFVNYSDIRCLNSLNNDLYRKVFIKSLTKLPVCCCLNVYFIFVRIILPLHVLILAHRGQSSHSGLVEKSHLVEVTVSDHSRCPPVLQSLRIPGSSDQLILNVNCGRKYLDYTVSGLSVLTSPRVPLSDLSGSVDLQEVVQPQGH